MGEGSQGFESVEVTRLRREIESAWSAFDDIDQMSWDHRVLVVRYVVGALPDAASTAARAGANSRSRAGCATSATKLRRNRRHSGP